MRQQQKEKPRCEHSWSRSVAKGFAYAVAAMFDWLRDSLAYNDETPYELIAAFQMYQETSPMKILSGYSHGDNCTDHDGHTAGRCPLGGCRRVTKGVTYTFRWNADKYAVEVVSCGKMDGAGKVVWDPEVLVYIDGQVFTYDGEYTCVAPAEQRTP